MNLIELDGSQGEGGGQILRTALSLSAITGIPFRIKGIRACRKKPGLLRQHLTAVNAAAKVCQATVSGNTLGSAELSFVPGKISGGDYHFAIGTAGSCPLVLQTVLPILWHAGQASTVTVVGGTHNPSAPSVDFLKRVWLPVMHRMGVTTEIEILHHGFYPAGGGELHAKISPLQAWQPVNLHNRGDLMALKAIAVVAGIPADVARRELARINTHFDTIDNEQRILPDMEGPGNVVMIEMVHAHITELVFALGERGLRAETVADRACKVAHQYLSQSAPVGEHLADQMLLPLALAGHGSFTTTYTSLHFLTNIETIANFVPFNPELRESSEGVQVVL